MNELGACGFRGAAGVARRDITPPDGIRNRNWGPAPFDTSRGVHQPLAATALALAAEHADPVVILTLDGTWWRRVDDEARLRAAVLDAADLAEPQLLIALSHTHAGPVLCAAERDLPGGELIPGYLDTVSRSAADAVREALSALTPAVVEWASGHCDVAANRDLWVNGRALVGFNPVGPADDTVLVGRVAREDGNLLATIVNYACHPTTLAWQNRAISPDYVGAMREVVEARTDAPCLFVQGASGDLAPREQYSGDPAVAERHGSALGHAALSALMTMPSPGMRLSLDGVAESGAPLALWRAHRAELPDRLAATITDVRLPLRDLPTLAQLEAEWAGIDPRSRDERLRRARNLREGYIDETAQAADVIHRIWTLRIGDAVVVAHPGEAYSAFQLQLRRQFPGRAVIVMNLTNGPGFVYLPDEQAYRRGAYQAWQTPLADGALSILTRAAIDAVGAILD